MRLPRVRALVRGTSRSLGLDCRGPVCPLGLGNATAAHLFRLAWPGGTTAEAPIPRLVAGLVGRRAQDALRLSYHCSRPATCSSPRCCFSPSSSWSLSCLRHGGQRVRSVARLTSPFSLARVVAVRFRVRTALATIAILGLYLGWEINAWRTWRMRSFTCKKPAEAAGRGQSANGIAVEPGAGSATHEIESSLLSRSVDSRAGLYRSKAPSRRRTACNQDRLNETISELSAPIAALCDCGSESTNGPRPILGRPCRRMSLCQRGTYRSSTG